MQKKHWLTIAAAAAIIIVGGYVFGGIHYQGRFLPNTSVLGVNVSGQTTAKAVSTLKTNYKQQEYKLTDGKKTVATATSSELGISNDFSKTVKDVQATQNAWSWPLRLFGSEKTAKADSNLAVNESTLTAYAAQTTTTLNKNRQAPINASMTFTNGKVTVKASSDGNQINKAKLVTQLKSMINHNQHTVDLAKTYNKATITTTSKTFKEKRQVLEQYSNITGKLTVANHSETISKKDLNSWIGYSNGKITVNESDVRAFVSSFDNKYATYGKTRSFKSTKRGTVSVVAGNYGWVITTSTTTKNLIAAIKKGKDFTVAATVNGSGYHADGSDIGNTYVEIDKENQHEYFYKDGKLVLDSDVVTGKPDGHTTPTGVLFVWKKEQNATLRGTNSNGSSYASNVKYWMPIDYTGVGLHDASWQPTFGGDWYKQHGSHGCVNNPPSFMAKLYAAVPVGTPVIVF